MAKAAILDVLESTIGRYVENLDAQSLNVAVWKGQIELNSLRLDVDAVNRELARKAAEAPNLALPFRVVDGSFKNLQVDVPWTRITSKPVVLRASGLNILIEPFDHLAVKEPDLQKIAKSSVKKREQKLIEDRLKYIEHADEGRQRMNAMREIANIEESIEDHDALDKSSQERNTSSGFKERLVRRIIENMQLDIDGVKLGLKGNGCSAGIIFSLSIFTTDENGNQTYVDRATSSKNPMKSFLNKMLKLKEFGIYCDEDKASSTTQFAETNATDTQQDGKNFILSPLSFEARLRQSDCLNCIDFPKYSLSAELPSVSIIFSRTQHELLSGIAQEITSKRMKSRPLFPEYRPIVPISKKSTKAWWKYAVRCVGRVNRSRSWTEFFIAFQKRKAYVALYKRYTHHSSCSWIDSLTTKEKLELQEIEKDRTISVQGIMNWRNIADAQVAYERRVFEEKSGNRRTHASPKKGSGFSLFGKKKGDDSYVEFDDEPPIELTVDDMKELEALATTHASSEETLSSDSKLYDLRFMLGSFKVDLFTFNSQHLASLDMGTVSAGFKAKANGSFDASFSLASFNVYDHITCNSLFPVVVRSLQSTDSSTNDTLSSAFEVNLAKSKDGDQNLSVRLVSFEIIGSTILMKEMKHFMTPPRKEVEHTPRMSNPLLEQTISGGADLFYDADDIRASTIVPANSKSFDEAFHSPKNKVKVTDKIASAFADAWDSKVEQETSWQVELDIRAPILVVPKNSIDPLSTVLVVDLGNFNFTYGKNEPTPDIQKWLDARTIESDHGSLEMDNLSFFIGEAGKREWLECDTRTSVESLNAIIEPISLSVGFAIENDSKRKGTTRKALIGILPSVSLNISYSQIERIVSVASTWTSEIGSLTPTNAHTNEVLIESDVLTNETVENNEQSDIQQKSISSASNHDIIDISYVSLGLQRLSMRVSNDRGDSVEAHLVSALASSTMWSNQSTTMRIRMGWFWLLDGLHADYPRRQRLVAHSSLPKSAAYYSQNDYKVMANLEDEGVFQGEHASKSLADITISKRKYSDPTFGDSGVIVPAQSLSVTSIDARFSTLVLHWHPYAIRNLLSFKDSFMMFSSKVKSSMNKDTTTIIDAEIESAPNKPLHVLKDKADSNMIRIKAEMDSLELCLNSAKDDMSLFHLTMSDSKMNVNLYNENLFTTASIGDLRLEIPANDSIEKDYLTLLGLSPNHSTSLLNLEYGKGPLSLKGCNITDVDKNKTESYMKLELSPMRFVHIQAQVLTLVEYITEGVLGAIASKVASSAARAAIDIAQSQAAGEKLFYIRASGFDFILPEAAYSENNFILHADNLFIRYKALTKPGAGQCFLKLGDVTMECNRDDSVIETPIQMEIDIRLAPLDAPTEEDKAMRVALTFSRAALILTRSQYSQVLRTLERNIGETNSFLRQNNQNADTSSDIGSGEVSKLPVQNLTHGGAKEILIKKRIYMIFVFKVLSLQLCNENENDPIISIAAVETLIDLKLLPDSNMTVAKLSLHDLFVEDKRAVALNRHFRHIMRHDTAQSSESQGKDLFQLSYSKSNNDGSTDIVIDVGSPQVVLIPDALSEILKFFHKDEGSKLQLDKNTPTNTKMEISVPRLDNTKSTSTSLKLTTSDCSLVLIDVGSALASGNNFSESTETLVMKGQAEASLKVISDTMSGTTMESDFQLHGERIEVFKAEGKDLNFPVQILEPAKFSAFFNSTKQKYHNSINIAIVTLTPVQSTISMQNIAFVLGVLSSMSDVLGRTQNKVGDVSQDQKLSPDEAAEVLQLASELEENDSSTNDDQTGYESSHRIESDSSCAETIADEDKINRTISCKLTLPDIAVTVINDLQGLDQALFKIGMRSCVFGVDLSTGSDVISTMIFRSQMNTTIDAEYFISHLNTWSPLLLTPWELSFKATRGQSSKFKSSTRMSTTIDIESRPCRLSISEQFVVGLSATSTMWSVFSTTTQKAMDLIDQQSKESDKIGLSQARISLMKSRAFYAARSLVTTLPYGVENSCGLSVKFEVGTEYYEVENGSRTYFSFEPPRYRSYGKDMKQQKGIYICIEGHKIYFPHIDDEVNKPQSIHDLGKHLYVVIETKKVRKTTIVHVSSCMSLRNETSLGFSLSVNLDGRISFVGAHDGNITVKESSTTVNSTSIADESHNIFKDGIIGIPTDFLQKVYFNDGHEKVASIILSMAHNDLQCEFKLPPLQSIYKMAEANATKSFETICSSSKATHKRMIFQVFCRASLIQKTHPSIEFSIQPRMRLQNNMCVDILLRSPMPHTYARSGLSQQDPNSYEKEIVHHLRPSDNVEVYTPGNAIAISVKFADNPVSGTPTDWSNKRGFIDIPLGQSQRLQEDINGVMPFVNKSTKVHNILIGSDFLITEAPHTWKDLHHSIDTHPSHGKSTHDQNNECVIKSTDRSRIISLSIDNLGVDHTGEILFENIKDFQKITSKEICYALPLCSFSSRNRRITILPHSSIPICLLLLTMDGRGDYIRSLPFRIEDIAICDGGLHSTAIELREKYPMRYFAYRRLTMNNQYEVHIIPEFVIFNGGKSNVNIILASGDEYMLGSKKVTSLNRFNRNDGLVISFQFLDIDAETSPSRLDSLGLKVVLIKSRSTGCLIGSIPVQTMLGTLDSRFVIKVGEINYEGVNTRNSHGSDQSMLKNVLSSDFLRFRVRWSELEVTVRDTAKDSTSDSCLAMLKGRKESNFPRVARMQFSKVTLDYQQLFKENDTTERDDRKSKARSQISMIIGDVIIVDCTVSPESVMLASTMKDSNFLDICIRTKDSNHSKVVSTIDLIQIRLNHDSKTSYPIIVRTNEKFLWYLLDISSRIMKATAELSGAKISLDWDEAKGDFVATVVEKVSIEFEEFIREDGTYKAPRSDRLFAVKKIHISPASFLVSFKRQPLTSRYQSVKHVRGAKIINYFTKKLKFTIENARLEFSGYILSNMKGPPDRFIENIKVFYVSQVKFKVFNLLTATSLDDWKLLSGRAGGTDEYVDGDILRVTGNLAGKSAGYLLKKVGQGIGLGVSASTAGIGDGIQNASEALGIGVVGAGVNSVVSGLGEGVSDTVQGVGSAGSKIVKGAGKGVGQIVGGVGGGLVMASKGIGTGVVTGDGKAVLNGLGDGILHMGTGIIDGTESVVTGTASGVYSAGKGLFSGLKSIGKGLEGAVVPKKRSKK